MAPEGDWDIWLALAGRGWGKTEAGAQWVRELVETNQAGKIALVAETAADARDVVVSRILSIFPPDKRPVYVKSNRLIEFQNGAKAWTYNATEPDQLRGPEHDAAWSDEIAKWKYARETWDMLQFGLRLGDHPRQCVTTTPRPIELVKAMVAGQEGKVIVTRGRTMDNRSNLAARFLDRIQKRYAGTRLGRQELEAELLGDLPGALWRQSTIDTYREARWPEMDKVVVAVDPAVTNTEDSDEHGIIVAGAQGESGYVVEDASISGSPTEWAEAAIMRANKYAAKGIVVEINQGGDMVAHVIRTLAPNMNVIEVRATKGKHVRAEPVAALYEQGRIRHIGQFPELEAQMTQMTNEGYQGEGSPDRLDALVWAFTELFPDMVRPVADASKYFPNAASGGWMGR
jgi:phage terminase large subunit-like protein